MGSLELGWFEAAGGGRGRSERVYIPRALDVESLALEGFDGFIVKDIRRCS